MSDTHNQTHPRHRDQGHDADRQELLHDARRMAIPARAANTLSSFHPGRAALRSRSSCFAAVR